MEQQIFFMETLILQFQLLQKLKINLKLELVYCPIYDELFFAERGKGAFLNDRRLRVAKRNKLSDSVVVTGIPHIGRGNKEQFIKKLKKLYLRFLELGDLDLQLLI